MRRDWEDINDDINWFSAETLCGGVGQRTNRCHLIIRLKGIHLNQTNQSPKEYKMHILQQCGFVRTVLAQYQKRRSKQIEKKNNNIIFSNEIQAFFKHLLEEISG